MKIKWVFIFLALLIFQLSSYSQELKDHSLETKKEKKEREKKEKKEKEKKDLPENIEKFERDFLFRPRFVYPAVIFNVTNRKTNAEQFNWQPNIPGIVGASLKIKKFYISAAFKLPSSDASIKLYGNTKFSDFSLNFLGRVMLWTFFYRDYKCFYLYDYKKFYPKWNQDSLGFPQSKHLHVIEGGVNIGFNFNKNFSMNAAFAQSERQKKSAGSFLMNFSERYQRIETDSNIVPTGINSSYPNLDRLSGGDFLTTIISLGAGYQFVKKQFHFTPVILVGTGVQFQNYWQGSSRRFYINVPTYANFKAQVGWNGDHFFMNLIYIFEYNTIPIKETRISLYRSYAEFGCGIRF